MTTMPPTLAEQIRHHVEAQTALHAVLMESDVEAQDEAVTAYVRLSAAVRAFSRNGSAEQILAAADAI